MTPEGVIFDFHRTLVVRGSLEDWIEQASAQTGMRIESTQVSPVLRQVWARAALRCPDASWDLDPDLHRSVFIDVVTEEGHCPEEFALALYDLMPRQWVAAPGAVDLLAGLRARGHRLGLLSNTALDLRPRLAELGILGYLDSVVLSFEESLVKPDPRIFVLAARRLGLDPSECVHVGDSPVHDGGAVQAGMTCLLVPVVEDRPVLRNAAALLLGSETRSSPRPGG